MTRALIVLVLLGRIAVAGPTEDAKRIDDNRLTRLLLVGGAIGLYATSETVAKPTLASDTCRWCASNPLDDGVRDALRWSDQKAAGDASNLTGYALSPLVGIGLLMVSAGERENRWTTFTDDLITVAEATAYSQLIVQVIKFSAARQRPYAHYMTDVPDPERHDANLSFLSGHSALTFSIAVGAGTVAHRRGYKLEPLIWATGLGLAATTAYLRIAADKHYFTDVMSGSILGAAAGFLIPRLTRSLPGDMAIAPTGNGLALSGSF